MHLYQLFSGITVPLSNREHSVLEKVASTNLLDINKLEPEEMYTAEELFRKGILKKTLKDSIVHFFIKNDEIDREPLS